MARPVSAERALARAIRLIVVSSTLTAVPALALESLDEAAMAGVTAQDGLVLDWQSTSAVTANQLQWVTDRGAAAGTACTGGVANQHACTIASLGLQGVNGSPLHTVTTLDAFGGPGTPGIALNMTWDPLLVSSNQLTLATPTADYSARSIGSVGMYSTGHLRLLNQEGVLNSSGNTARFDFSTTGDIILRQGAVGTPEMSLGNFELSTRFSTGAAAGQLDGSGKIGIDSQGLVIAAPFTDTAVQFDLMFKGSPSSAFDRTGRLGILHFGWMGGLVNPSMRIAAGGVGYGTYNSTTQNVLGSTSYSFQNDTGVSGGRSEGLNLLAQWDFDSDFALVIGQAGGNKTSARFSNWRRMATLPAGTPMLSMPVTLDILQNDVGPQGLCFGGGFSSGMPTQGACSTAGGIWVDGGVAPGKAALAALIRDGRLHAYNQQINVIDPNSANPYSTYDWGLVYTMGKLDADLLFYPEGRNQGVVLSTNNTGLKTDITLAIQSPGFWNRANCILSTSTTACTGTGTAANAQAVRASATSNWATNSHFMVADTAVGGDTTKQYGVGLMNADLLWSVRDLYFRMVNSDSGYPDIPGGIWMQTDSKAQFQFRGLFGGGNLMNMANPVSVGLLDVNISTNRFLFALHPDALISGDAPIGFTGLLDLDGTSKISLAEVASPGSAYTIGNISGRIGWKNGRVNLVSGQNAPDGLPSLSISNDLLFGESANFGSGGGAPVVATVGFGGEGFGRVALPAGAWRSEVSLRIPTN